MNKKDSDPILSHVWIAKYIRVLIVKRILYRFNFCRPQEKKNNEIGFK